MKNLKVSDEQLHHRFKSLCVLHKISMMDAVDKMLRSWCDEVEKHSGTLPRYATENEESQTATPSHRVEMAAQTGKEGARSDQEQGGGK